jgi:hypothetical protein
MKIRLLHPRTGLPIKPVGYRRSGAPIWPILGASADDADSGADAEDEGAEPEGASTDGDGDGDDASSDEGADQLGDAGKQALARMKSERNAARREARELKRQLEQAQRPVPPEGEAADPDALKAEGRREAIAEANQRILRVEVRAAAAAAQFNDPADALQYLDLASFGVDDDGNVDPEEIGDAIADLLTKKPYLAAQGGKRFQGGADGGPRNGADKPPTLDEQIRAAQAAGRTRDVIALNNQRLAELAGKS